ncbi:MAG TPA: hypothetical protein VM509_04565 [Planctomycetota bacterium]|nr:hypothetical protein [Planctomycetota bacterium]
MSRKFRWFLLATCAFLVLMGGRESFVMLAEGPQQSPSPERKTHVAAERKASSPAPARRFKVEGELARGDARKQPE